MDVLIGGTRPFPKHYVHPRGCISGDLAEKQEARETPVGRPRAPGEGALFWAWVLLLAPQALSNK